MKKKITFETWVSVLIGGIEQFVRNIFSWKNKTPFWRVVWAILTVCFIAITSMLGYAFYHEFCRNNAYLEYYDSKISEKYKFRNNGYNKGKSYIYDTRTHQKVLKGIDWIALPESGDSLIVVAKNGKRGFINRFTAKTVIPFKYDAAWSFTDGVAAVCQGDSVYFIDHSGVPVNDKKFVRVPGYGNYVYHGNYAAIPIEDKYGLINRKGEWAVAPEFEDIHIGSRNMWYAKHNSQWGVIGNNGQFIIPMEYADVFIHPNNGITLIKNDNSKSRYDYNGELIDEFIFDDVYELYYYIDEFDKEGEQKKAVDNMLRYSAGDYYGLMTRHGVPVTLPLYSWIDCIAPGLYQCQLPHMNEYIMINSEGKKINK